MERHSAAPHDTPANNNNTHYEYALHHFPADADDTWVPALIDDIESFATDAPSGPSQPSGIGPQTQVSDVERDLQERIFHLKRQLDLSREEAASMKAAFSRRSNLCRKEVNTVVQEFISTGNAVSDHSRNTAIARYVNFINAVTDGATEKDLDTRMEEAASLFRRHRTFDGLSATSGFADFSPAHPSSGLPKPVPVSVDGDTTRPQVPPKPTSPAAASPQPSPRQSQFGADSASSADFLMDPAALGSTLDRIVELRNERDGLGNRLSTLSIRYALLLEKLKGREVAHARITRDLQHRCEELGRHQLSLNRTIISLEARLAASIREKDAVLASYERHRHDTSMEKALTSTQVAQLEAQLRAELLRRDPAAFAALSRAAGDATGASALATNVNSRPCVEYACDISLDGSAALRNPSREMLERLVAECAAMGATAAGGESAPFAGATASKALLERVGAMEEEASVWRLIAVTTQAERNKAEALCVTLNEELGRLQEAARDRKVDLPFDMASARARAALHSLSDEKANFKEMTRTLRSESFEAAKRVHRLRRELERLVVPADIIKAREAGAAATKAQSMAHLHTQNDASFGRGGLEYTNLGTLAEEMAALEVLEGDLRQTLVDNVVWRKAAQRDLAIAHDQIFSERSLWVQQWHTLLDGLPPEISSAIQTDGLAALAADSAVSTLVAIVEHARRVMMAEARAALASAEESARLSRKLITMSTQTEPTLPPDDLQSSVASDSVSTSSPLGSPTRGPLSARSPAPQLGVDTATQTVRRWYASNMAMQRIGSFTGLPSDGGDSSAFLTSVGGMEGQRRRGSQSVRSASNGQFADDDGDYDIKDAATSPRPPDVRSTYVQCAVSHIAASVGTDHILSKDASQQFAPLCESVGITTDRLGIDIGAQCSLLADFSPPASSSVHAQTMPIPSRTIAIGSDLTFEEQAQDAQYRNYLSHSPQRGESAFPTSSSQAGGAHSSSVLQMGSADGAPAESAIYTSVPCQTDSIPSIGPLIVTAAGDLQAAAGKASHVSEVVSRGQQTDPFVVLSASGAPLHICPGADGALLCAPVLSTSVASQTVLLMDSWDEEGVGGDLSLLNSDADTAAGSDASDYGNSEGRTDSATFAPADADFSPNSSQLGGDDDAAHMRTAAPAGNGSVRSGSVPSKGTHRRLRVAKGARVAARGPPQASEQKQSTGTFVDQPPGLSAVSSLNMEALRARAHPSDVSLPSQRLGSFSRAVGDSGRSGVQSPKQPSTYRSKRSARNIFMFDTDVGSSRIVASRDVEVQVCIRRPRSCMDASAQCGPPTCHEGISAPSAVVCDRASSPLPMPSPKEHHSAEGWATHVGMGRGNGAPLAEGSQRAEAGAQVERSGGHGAGVPLSSSTPIDVSDRPMRGRAADAPNFSVGAGLGVAPLRTQPLTPQAGERGEAAGFSHPNSVYPIQSAASQHVASLAPLASTSQCTASRQNAPPHGASSQPEGTSDASEGPGLFWKVEHKCVGTDMDSRALHDLTIADAARSMMGVRSQDHIAPEAEPGGQRHVSMGLQPPLHGSPHPAGASMVGSSSLHPGTKRLPRASGVVGGNALDHPSTVAGPASVSGVIRVLEPIGVYGSLTRGSSALGGAIRRASADGRGGNKVSHSVSAGPGMRKQTPFLPALTPEEELRAQMLARSQSPPFPMFHHSSAAAASQASKPRRR